MKTIVLKVRNLPNNVDNDLFVYCMQQDVATSYPKGKVELIPEIVQCRDCVKCIKEPNGDLYCDVLAVGYEPLGSKKVTEDWFCADATRR